jgi:hypothetical protein
MARLLGPDPSTQLAIRVGRWTPVIPKTYSNGLATIYTDAAATVPASIAEYNAGAPNTPGAVIPQSQIRLSSESMFPLFWFPDGVDVVYAKMRDGEIFRLVADVDRRLDAIGDGGGGVPDRPTRSTPSTPAWTRPRARSRPTRAHCPATAAG